MNVTVRLIHKAFVRFNPPLTCCAVIPLISELLVCGDDVRASFTRLQTSTLEDFLQTREPEFTEHCWQPFTKGDETRRNSSVANANSQRSGSTTGCFSCFSLSGMAQAAIIGAMSLTARLRCGPLLRLCRWFPTSEIQLETSASCSSFQSLHVPPFKVCVTVSAASTTSVEGSLFSAPVNQNKNWEKLPAAFFSFFCLLLFFLSSDAPASEAGGSFASQEHSFLQMPFRLISQFINSTFSARLFDYPVKWGC